MIFKSIMKYKFEIRQMKFSGFDYIGDLKRAKRFKKFITKEGIRLF
jgi:hypothetical protein